ncbi:YihA family ribosome biogenesis GTP-binding protein [Flavobacteriaceae bacterium (ex Bugula neritina AB1)]|nr:YihA family ribosome biogenesis GTP-binding protein [Flavobacteriaceae bacterium (ex Bugula neritina AB1)]
MKINSAEFVISNSDVAKCPKENLPEYAFIGRSNVGKSSLINMLTDRKSLAKTSGKPGKTQLINHFIINKSWFLVDLPGYGYAKVSKSAKKVFQKFITSYFSKRSQLVSAFVLVDCRHEPQKIDLEFMQWLGENQIPFSIIFTKADKLTKTKLPIQIEQYINKMLEYWEEMPKYFITSSTSKQGKEEVLNYIQEINTQITSS